MVAGTAAPHCAPAAVVVDDGRTFRGTEEISGFLRHAGAEFRYTTELVGARRTDDSRWVVTQRLEGDFPGGVVELDHRFTLAGGLVAELVVVPSRTQARRSARKR